jgi:hypothetical protein
MGTMDDDHSHIASTPAPASDAIVDDLQDALDEAAPSDAPEIAEALAKELGERLDPPARGAAERQGEEPSP